jgi:hypothetical protein
VGEVSRTGKEHSDTSSLCSSNHFFVSDASAWLHNGDHPSPGKNLYSIGKWEEGITCRNRSRYAITGAINCEFGAIDSIDLAHSNSNCCAISRNDNCIALHCANAAPGKFQIGQYICAHRNT